MVVTGMGTLNPLGRTVEEYWDSLIEGRSGAAPLEGVDSSRLTTKFACQVKGFDPAEHLGRKLAQRSARFTQLALVASGHLAKNKAGAVSVTTKGKNARSKRF